MVLILIKIKPKAKVNRSKRIIFISTNFYTFVLASFQLNKFNYDVVVSPNYLSSFNVKRNIENGILKLKFFFKSTNSSNILNSHFYPFNQFVFCLLINLEQSIFIQEVQNVSRIFVNKVKILKITFHRL